MSATKSYVLSMQGGTPSRIERYVESRYVEIDAETVAATTVFTTADDLGLFCVTDAVFQVVTCDVEPDTPQATVSIGAVSAAYADCIPATALTVTYALDRLEVLYANDHDALFVKYENRAVAASTAIKVNVSVGAVTTGSLVYRVHVRGFYLG